MRFINFLAQGRHDFDCNKKSLTHYLERSGYWTVKLQKEGLQELSPQSAFPARQNDKFNLFIVAKYWVMDLLFLPF